MLGTNPLTEWDRAPLLETFIKVRGAWVKPKSMLGKKEDGQSMIPSKTYLMPNH